MDRTRHLSPSNSWPERWNILDNWRRARRVRSHHRGTGYSDQDDEEENAKSRASRTSDSRFKEGDPTRTEVCSNYSLRLGIIKGRDTRWNGRPQERWDRNKLSTGTIRQSFPNQLRPASTGGCKKKNRYRK